MIQRAHPPGYFSSQIRPAGSKFDLFFKYVKITDIIDSDTKKPNLFIVGAPRCGTTSMYAYLNQHPDIFMSENKELHYFGNDLNRITKLTDMLYAINFSDWNDEKYGGEASVTYLYSESAANELKEYNPSARIVIMLRNPVDFLYSYYSQLRGIGYEDITDFEAALDAEPERRQGKRIPWLTRKLSKEKLLYYHDVAAFTEQVQRYFDTFGKDAVHVIILDDLKVDPAGVYRETLNFLGVDPDFEAEFTVSNREHTQVRSTVLLPVLSVISPFALSRNLLSRACGKLVYWPLYRWNKQRVTRSPMPAQLRQHLTAEFALEVDQLSELLGRDLRYWSNSAQG